MGWCSVSMLLWVILHRPVFPLMSVDQNCSPKLQQRLQRCVWKVFVPEASRNVSSLLVLQVTLAKMRSHVSSCAKVQEQMANCPKFVPVVPTSQPIPRYRHTSGREKCPFLQTALALPSLTSPKVQACVLLSTGQSQGEMSAPFPSRHLQPLCCPVFWRKDQARAVQPALGWEWAGLVAAMHGYYKAEQGVAGLVWKESI